MDMTTLKTKLKENAGKTKAFASQHRGKIGSIALATGALGALFILTKALRGNNENNERDFFTSDEDHSDEGLGADDQYDDYDDYFEDDCGERLSADVAADIYRSSGYDEDYQFGYSHDELVDTLER